MSLQITWRDIPQSDAVEADIRARAEKLNQFCDCIIGCKVAVGSSNRSKHKGNVYRINLDIQVPGKEIAVTHEPGDQNAHEDMYVTIHDAFDAARRQLQDYMRIRRGQVKHHADSGRAVGQPTESD